MSIIFERVLEHENEKISEVYEIIKLSGEHMNKKEGLTHWGKPYPLESIRKNCREREVFLGKDVEADKYVHTYQLEFHVEDQLRLDKLNEQIVTLNKFATIPHAAGRGIGKLSLDYIEEYSKSRGMSKIQLDVYDKSKHAISFYEKRGFVVTGSKPTRRFTVYLMEKDI